MTDFSSAPSSSRDRYRTGHGSRPRTPTARASTSHAYRHRKTSSDAGTVARFLELDHRESPPSSPASRAWSSRIPTRVAQGHNHPGFTAQSPPSTPKVRGNSGATLPRNEVFPACRMPASGRPTPGIQAPQREHAPAGCTTNLPPLMLAQVPASSNEPPSLSSSLTSPAPSLAAPPTPQSHRSSRHIHRRRAFITPSASVSSFRSDARSCEDNKARCEQYTSSPSPLSHASRETRRSSHRTSPVASPPLLAIKRGLVPQRARPTLAMSMQIHAPTPVLSTSTTSPPLPPTSHSLSRSRAGSASRPSSPLASTVPPPQRPPMPRPPSRSERLLRDTLRRAEEQERVMNPTPSLFKLGPPTPGSPIPPAVAQMFGPCRLPAATHGGRRHRRNTSSSVQSDSSCDYFDDIVDEESPEDEEPGEWLWRASASPSHGYGHAHYSARTAPGGKAEAIPYGTPASPSPARAQLQRAAQSSPSVPRRHSHSQSVSHVPAHPPSRGSLDADCSTHTVTPHEAVLRSKLEGVLKNARAQDRRTRSVERRDPDSGFSSGNSMASSRNRSGEGDFFFGANGDSSLTSLSSNEPAKHRAAPSVSSSPRVPARHIRAPPPGSPRSAHKPLSSQKGSSSGGLSPLTPPPSPPFNALQAAAQCKAMDGYISFANIEGLGIPEGSDDETDEDAKSRSRWFQWLHISGKATNDRARDRSDSSSASR
ncbi:hypothetical protein DICSQDRAFT_152474 [Dichomitus squalens LYAD-421 SS1]|uniref:uncharacterized protein n=1 Tax=Dichomitus squalens (strain LYAD-421) TaxID=732165 RepID=UPI0004410EDC|nr:uncharacterized protein DICSQDRAFT_152474 [Dichomitus squalens LYAD-421 SS1]EJF65219.1 hypothetical protein DICSQDRAFT_152474 [Dichomitus squalens LYAD-421 SS1]